MNDAAITHASPPTTVTVKFAVVRNADGRVRVLRVQAARTLGVPAAA